MKKTYILILAISVGVLFSSCELKNKTIIWEYKTVTVVGNNPMIGENKYSADTEAEAMNAIASSFNDAKFLSRAFLNQEKTLNDLGTQGWELVDIYTLIETVHPNYGDLKYVSGLQPNVRTSQINYVFKRRK